MDATYHLTVALDLTDRAERELTALALRLTSLHHRRGVALVALTLAPDRFTSEFRGTTQQAQSIVNSLGAVVGVDAAHLRQDATAC